MPRHKRHGKMAKLTREDRKKRESRNQRRGRSPDGPQVKGGATWSLPTIVRESEETAMKKLKEKFGLD